MKAIKSPTIRPTAAVYEVLLIDEAGRSVEFRVQVDASGLAMWTPNQKDVLRQSWSSVFAFLATRAGGAE